MSKYTTLTQKEKIKDKHIKKAIDHIERHAKSIEFKKWNPDKIFEFIVNGNISILYQSSTVQVCKYEELEWWDLDYDCDILDMEKEIFAECVLSLYPIIRDYLKK